MKKLCIFLLIMLLFTSVCGFAAADALQDLYNEAQLLMIQGQYLEAAAKFEALMSYSDSAQMALYAKAIYMGENGMTDLCVSTMEMLGEFKDAPSMAVYYTGRGYEAAAALLDPAACSYHDLKISISATEKAIEHYQKNMLFKDALLRINSCQTLAKTLQQEIDRRYANGLQLIANGSYQEGIAALKEMSGYGSSAAAIQYATGCMQMEKGSYTEAITSFRGANGYSDAADRITQCQTFLKDAAYAEAMALKDSGKYTEAISAFKALNGYSDSATQISLCQTALNDAAYDAAIALMESGRYEEAITAFTAIQSWRDSLLQITLCQNAIKDQDYDKAMALLENGEYGAAYTAFIALGSYRNADQMPMTDERFIAARTEQAKAFTKVGGSVTFGHYEKDGDTANGKEPFDWIVLEYDSTSNIALLISKYVISGNSSAVHPKGNAKYTGWADSEIRTWLNSSFLKGCFSPEEQQALV